MGNEQIKFDANHKYRYYTSEKHSIQGLVDVYRQQGENFFIMKKVTMHSDQIITLANKIMKIVNNPKNFHSKNHLSENSRYSKNKSLDDQQKFKYFGHERNNQTAVCNDIIHSNSVTTFWEYFNHDLEKDALLRYQSRMIIFSIQNNINAPERNSFNFQLKGQNKIWKILSSAVNSFSQLWNQPGLGIALQFTKHNIIFAPDRSVKIYWGNIENSNTHRGCFRYLQGYGLTKSCYSAEQLQSMRNNRLNRTLNLQKTSIFSLGMLLLSYIVHSQKNIIFSNNSRRFSSAEFQASNVAFDHSQFYCYDTLSLKFENIQKALNFCHEHYSSLLFITLRRMIELDITKRINISELSEIVNSAQVDLIANKINNEKTNKKDNVSSANTSQKMFIHQQPRTTKKDNQKISLRM